MVRRWCCQRLVGGGIHVRGRYWVMARVVTPPTFGPPRPDGGQHEPEFESDQGPALQGPAAIAPTLPIGRSTGRPQQSPSSPATGAIGPMAATRSRIGEHRT